MTDAGRVSENSTPPDFWSDGVDYSCYKSCRSAAVMSFSTLSRARSLSITG